MIDVPVAAPASLPGADYKRAGFMVRRTRLRWIIVDLRQEVSGLTSLLNLSIYHSTTGSMVLFIHLYFLICFHALGACLLVALTKSFVTVLSNSRSSPCLR